MNYPRCGEIYWADLGDPNGHTQGGVRPVLICSNDAYNKYSGSVNYIALTSKKKRNLPVHTLLKSSDTGFLRFDSTVMPEQTGTIDKTKLGERLGRPTQEQLKEIAKGFVKQFPLTALVLND